MISVQGLSRSFDGLVAVRDLTFSVPEGKLFALLGPNGAGKTTTVRLLLGLIGASAGSARVAGFELGRDPESNRAIRAACGLLTETPGCYDRMSAWDNLLFFGKLYGLSNDVVRQRAWHYLKLMELWDRRDGPVGAFSKGMKQRLAIIRALFHDPKVVFLDEPTAGLDLEATLAVRELILQLKTEGRTIVVCTHNLDEAERLADIVGILRQRLLVCDTLEHLRAGSGDTLVHIGVRSGSDSYAVAVRALPGVAQVEAVGPRLRVKLTDPATDVPRVVATLVGAGAEILEVSPEAPSLEAIYLRCVREET